MDTTDATAINERIRHLQDLNRADAARLQSMLHPMLGWKSWAFILAAVAVFAWFLVQDMNAWDARMAAEMTRYRTFMRECVPTQPERRCDEIWRWVKR